MAALDNKPELPWWLEQYIVDFGQLCTFRTYGFNSPNPIDLPTIFFYIKLHGIRNVERFLVVIEKLDTLFLKHAAKKATKSDIKG